MAQWIHEDITCPSCHTTFPGLTASDLAITRSSDVHEALVAGRLHLFDCPGCGRRVLHEKPAIYIDLDRRRFAVVQPRTQMGAWRRAEDDARDLFRRHIEEEPSGALFTAEDVAAFWVRVVFGYDRLTEKLRLLDAGWDDRVLEAMKLMLLAGHPALMPRGYHELLVTELRPARREVALLALGPRGEPGLEVTGAYDLYERLAADPELVTRIPALWAGPFVDYRRVTLDAPG